MEDGESIPVPPTTSKNDKMWSNVICHGKAFQRPSRKYAGGMISIRPNQDGVVAGYTGLKEIERKYNDNIVTCYLPPKGKRTQPIEAGYKANAWLFLKHPDYDVLRKIMDDVGRTLKMWAE